MNLVGKIFIVVILVLCLVFMALSMAVYTAQRNWREVVMLQKDQLTPGKELGLKWRLEDAKAQNEDLNNQKAGRLKRNTPPRRPPGNSPSRGCKRNWISHEGTARASRPAGRIWRRINAMPWPL